MDFAEQPSRLRLHVESLSAEAAKLRDEPLRVASDRVARFVRGLLPQV